MTVPMPAHLAAAGLHLIFTVISANPVTFESPNIPDRLWEVPGYPGKRTPVPHSLGDGSFLEIYPVDTAENKRGFNSGIVLETRDIGMGPHLADQLPFGGQPSKTANENSGRSEKGQQDSTIQGLHISTIIPNFRLKVTPQRRSFRTHATGSHFPDQLRDEITSEVNNREHLSDILPLLNGNLDEHAPQYSAEDLALFQHFLRSYPVVEESPGQNAKLDSHVTGRRRRSNREQKEKKFV